MPRRYSLPVPFPRCSYVPTDAPTPEDLPCPSPALLLEAIWHVAQPVTCMAALHPPQPPQPPAAPGSPRAGAGAKSNGSGNSNGNGSSSGPEGGGAAAGGGGGGSGGAPPPAFLLGTSGGVVQLVNADRVPANAADAADLNHLARSLASTWEVRLFGGPVTAAAFSQVRMCVRACVRACVCTV